MDKEKLGNLIKKIGDSKILVVGDLAIDEMIYGLEYYAKFGKDYTNTKKSAKASKKTKTFALFDFKVL